MLCKIARKKKKKHTLLDDSEAAAVGFAIPAAADLTSNKGIELLSRKVIKGDHPLSNKEIADIYKHVGGKKRIHFGSISDKIRNKNILKIDTSGTKPHEAFSYTDMFGSYSDKSPAILVSKNAPESVIANQMAQIESPVLKNKLLRNLHSLSGAFGMAMPGVAGVRYATARAHGEDKKTLDEIKKEDNIAAGILSLPTVVEATRNNLIALKAVKRMGKLNKRNVIPLALSELSYLATPALTPLTHKLIDTYYDWKEKKQKKRSRKKIKI